MDWATATKTFATALRLVGERTGDASRLAEEAAASFKAVRVEWTRDRASPPWAATQNNLGHALRALGTLRGDTKAIRAYDAALEEFEEKCTSLY